MLVDLTQKCKNWSSREGYNVVGICNHITAGTVKSAITWFCDITSKASSNYIVARDGTVYKMVDEANKAWAQGIINHPSAKLVTDVYPGINPNLYLISIEHEGTDGTLTEEQYQATLSLHKDIITRYGIPEDRDHIIGHFEIDSIDRPYCPGRYFPWERLMRDINPPPTPKPIPKPIGGIVMKNGDSGQNVYEMQLMLNKLGYNCGVADGIFGNGTQAQVIAFQKAKKLSADGIVGAMTLAALTNAFYEKCTTTGYRMVRDYGSTIHIYESSLSQDCDIVLAPTRAVLTQITEANHNIICKVNGGFFDMLPAPKDVYLGLFIDEGKYYSPECKAFIDLIYFKDGHTEIGRVSDMAKVQELQSTAKWAMGTSWSLIIDGHINIQNTQAFDHAPQKNPRTMVGQRKNGTWVLVVVQGRGILEAGINATQEAELMFRLGCINAVNMDGGGSSEMIVNNKIVNKPTDGRERAVRASVFIYNK